MTNAAKGAQTTDAGHPALAFLNTVADSGKTRYQNSFANGRDLLDQLQNAGLETPDETLGAGQMAPLLQLREAAYGVFSALAAGRDPFQEDALALETAIKSAITDAQFVPSAPMGAFRPGPMGGLHDLLALSFLELAQSPKLNRLRECRGCTHLFLDHGRGPGRRWCSMARCGNRAKVQSFRNRRRSSG